MFHPFMIDTLRIESATRELAAERARLHHVGEAASPRRGRTWRHPRGLVARLEMAPAGLTPRADTAPCATC